MNYTCGEDFINEVYRDLHTNKKIEKYSLRRDIPSVKLSKFFDYLEEFLDRVKKHDKDSLLLDFIYKKHVISELPVEYFDSKIKMARANGDFDFDITDDMKKEMLKVVQEDQKSSLKECYDFLTSDDCLYPMWFKYYVFTGFLSITRYDKMKESYGKRRKDNFEAYVSLNEEVIDKIYDFLSKKINEDLNFDYDSLLESGISFRKLYSYFISDYYKGYNLETDGVWVKYEMGDNYKNLWNIIKKQITGWCTQLQSTCKEQISSGDFYVYYTKDAEGFYTFPRIGIKMNELGFIDEVRGVAAGQNLDDNMIDILEEKLSEFSDGDKYLIIISDVRRLSLIYNKCISDSNYILTDDEICFLNSVETFGVVPDLRIKKLKNSSAYKRIKLND